MQQVYNVEESLIESSDLSIASSGRVKNSDTDVIAAKGYVAAASATYIEDPTIVDDDSGDLLGGLEANNEGSEYPDFDDVPGIAIIEE